MEDDCLDEKTGAIFRYPRIWKMGSWIIYSSSEQCNRKIRRIRVRGNCISTEFMVEQKAMFMVSFYERDISGDSGRQIENGMICCADEKVSRKDTIKTAILETGYRFAWQYYIISFFINDKQCWEMRKN